VTAVSAPRWSRRVAVCAAVVGVLIAAVVVLLARRVPHVPPLYSEGIARAEKGGVVLVPAQSPARYVAGTSLLEPTVSLPGAAVATTRDVQAARAWLAAGRVPGKDTRYAHMAERALLDLRLLTLPNGAALAAWTPMFRYVWPRDASFAVAAFSITGHHGDAERVLRFLASLQPDDGRWHARYLPNGQGGVPDDRGVQLDGAGWVIWATWCWYVTAPDRVAARSTLEDLWPMVARSAKAAASLDRRGLPQSSSDYWERRERKVTLGTAAPLVTGLRAAADLARQSGRGEDADRWGDTARRLDAAVRREFRPRGYPRTVPTGGSDAAVTFLAPPFAARDPVVVRALVTAVDRLRVGNGGVRPGEGWYRDGVAWTPATAMFALAFAGTKDDDRARHWLDWLATHRTGLGALPERVDPRGCPVSAAPLGWTGAIVLLALAALEDHLPEPVGLEDSDAARDLQVRQDHG